MECEMMNTTLVSICTSNKACKERHLRHGTKSNRWANGLFICEFDGNCNQKKIMEHNRASRTYGVTRNEEH